MIYKPLFQFSFAAGIRSAQEIKNIGILENLCRHVGIGGRQRRIEVVRGFPVSFMQAGFNLHGEDVAAPSILNGFGYIPLSD